MTISPCEGRCPLCLEFVFTFVKNRGQTIHRCRKAVKGHNLLTEDCLLKFIERAIRLDIDVIRCYTYLSSKYAN